MINVSFRTMPTDLESAVAYLRAYNKVVLPEGVNPEQVRNGLPNGFHAREALVDGKPGMRVVYRGEMVA